MAGHRPRKRFGQHFLHDPWIIQRIIQAINPRPGERLLEIGPGLGALTAPLLEAVGQLDVVELDRDVIAPLQVACAGRGVLRVHNEDVLAFDFSRLAGTGPLRVVGNLPYNISTPLIFHLLSQATSIHDMLFMVQKEVAGRMAAAPGSKDYGRLSVMVQWRCAVETLFGVSPGAFRPPPKVDSAMVHLIPHSRPAVTVDDESLFAALVEQAFKQRRKTLRNSLKQWLSADDIAAVGVEPAWRPEVLSLAQFAALTTAAHRRGSC
ncbi:MAG TPA: 16S rRNA (adenine(1518)-N(6)/adenine(1519)-N(6))-dimethyltransferase RsmA [Gammaproteobacteria bacterium]|nr:16S rRNA (adenine(1518)-N(6)/adenine(1519)-N(6))-dimethyltransferase RsmA [Gammaproteobacteria bacterium]